MNERYIICIDDESIVLNALKEQIQKSFDGELLVEVAESGTEALELIEELMNRNNFV